MSLTYKIIKANILLYISSIKIMGKCTLINIQKMYYVKCIIPPINKYNKLKIADVT